MIADYHAGSEWYRLHGERRFAFWSQLAPADVARRQVRWERLVIARRARETGMTLKEVGHVMCVTQERARQMLVKAERVRLKSTEVHGRWRSPIENWADPETVVEDMVKHSSPWILARNAKARAAS